VNWLLLAILGYVLVQFAIGTWVSRRMSSEADYILAGRRLGVGLITFSVFATYFGAEAIVASGGAVYEKGLTGALVDPVGYAVAIILVGVFSRGRCGVAGLPLQTFPHRHSAGVEQPVVVVLVPGSVIRGGPGALSPDHERQSGPGPCGAITLAAFCAAYRSRRIAGGGHHVIRDSPVVFGLDPARRCGGFTWRPHGLARRPSRAAQLFPRCRAVDMLEQLAVPMAAQSWPWS
jgi:hypothetical protein